MISVARVDALKKVFGVSALLWDSLVSLYHSTVCGVVECARAIVSGKSRLIDLVCLHETRRDEPMIVLVNQESTCVVGAIRANEDVLELLSRRGNETSCPDLANNIDDLLALILPKGTEIDDTRQR